MQIRMASAQIHPIGVPCVLIGEELSAAPNGGYLKPIRQMLGGSVGSASLTCS
jgi:hypothetical protein